jgi:diacylglycerol kinase (ATP)
MPRKFFQSFKYAGNGLKHAFWTQRNIRIHIVTAFLVVAFGLYLNISTFEMVAIILAICFVIMSEMINTAIEEMVDLIVKEHRREANIAKDVAAGAVLFSAFCAIITGLLIFVPHLFKI